MSDYEADVSLLRGQMANMLSGNDEQMAYVITHALQWVDIDDIIEQGSLSEAVDPEKVINSLRLLALAIEDGTLS